MVYTAVIDGPTRTNGSAVLAGLLANGSWDLEVERPGEVSELDVRFTTSGELRSGSTMVLSLPDNLVYNQTTHNRTTHNRTTHNQTTHDQARTITTYQHSWTLLNADVSAEEMDVN